MSVSGADMARFMLAHLNGGTLEGKRILKTETATGMRGRLISFSPAVNGMLHGFMELNWNGETIYGHAGDTLWFHSMTAMFPARNLGLFVAYNTSTGGRAVQEFFHAFVEHYFPAPLAPELPVPGDMRQRLRRFAGTYAPSRVSESDFTKITKLLSPMSIAVDPNGYLVTSAGGEVNRWRQAEPLVFAQVDGHRRLAFRETGNGQIAAACTSPICVVVLIRQPWWKARTFQLLWAGVSGAILVLAFVGFPLAAIVQRRRPLRVAASFARLIAWSTSAVFMAGLAAVLAGGGSGGANEILFAVPRAMTAGFMLFAAGALLSFAVAGFALAAWRRRWWRIPGRVSFTAVAIAALAAAGWLYQWNLIWTPDR
jgi:hypothetical protein